MLLVFSTLIAYSKIFEIKKTHKLAPKIRRHRLEALIDAKVGKRLHSVECRNCYKSHQMNGSANGNKGSVYNLARPSPEHTQNWHCLIVHR